MYGNDNRKLNVTMNYTTEIVEGEIEPERVGANLIKAHCSVAEWLLLGNKNLADNSSPHKQPYRIYLRVFSTLVSTIFFIAMSL